MNKQDEIHVYYNVEIYNDGDILKPAQYQDYRSEPIIKSCKGYRINLVRASFPTNSIPVHIFQVVRDPSTPSNINNGLWSIEYVKSNIDYPKNVQYIQSSDVFINTQNLPDPPTSSKFSNTTNAYYWVYSFDLIATMLNKTFKELNTAASVTDPAPYFVYENGKFNLIIHKNFVPGSGSYNGVEIYFNTYLTQDLLGGYNLYHYFPDYKLILDVDQPLQVYDTNYYKLTQEFKYAPQYLTPLSKILVTSATIKSRSQLVQSNFSALSSNNNNLRIIFTFQPDESDENAAQAVLNYYSNDFKHNNILDVQTTESLNSIDLSVYWQDKYNNTYPFYITFGKSISLSLLFSN